MGKERVQVSKEMEDVKIRVICMEQQVKQSDEERIEAEKLRFVAEEKLALAESEREKLTSLVGEQEGDFRSLRGQLREREDSIKRFEMSLALAESKVQEWITKN